MSLKVWHNYLLKEEVTHHHQMRDQATPVKREPEHHWLHGYDMGRKKSFDPSSKSFNFTWLNCLLPCRDEVAHLLRNSSLA